MLSNVKIKTGVIRYSGVWSIEQDADIVAFLYRDDYYERGGEEEEGLQITKQKIIEEEP